VLSVPTRRSSDRIPAIIPPGVAHVNAVFSVAIFDHGQLLQAACSMSSLLADFQVRSVPKGDVYAATVERLPIPDKDHPLSGELRTRALMLNSLTDAYADLWNSCTDLTSQSQAWTGGYGYPYSVSMFVLVREWSEYLMCTRLNS